MGVRLAVKVATVHMTHRIHSHHSRQSRSDTAAKIVDIAFAVVDGVFVQLVGLYIHVLVQHTFASTPCDRTQLSSSIQTRPRAQQVRHTRFRPSACATIDLVTPTYAIAHSESSGPVLQHVAVKGAPSVSTTTAGAMGGDAPLILAWVEGSQADKYTGGTHACIGCNDELMHAVAMQALPFRHPCTSTSSPL